MTRIEALYGKYGMDYPATIERCAGDEEMLAELLSIFIADGGFGSLCAALDSGDTEAAFRAAHALKGSTGMLGMTRLYIVLCDMTECLRRGDINSARTHRDSAQREYGLVSEMIGCI